MDAEDEFCCERCRALERKVDRMLGMLAAPGAGPDGGDTGVNGERGGLVERDGLRYAPVEGEDPAVTAAFWDRILDEAGLGPDGPAAG